MFIPVLPAGIREAALGLYIIFLPYGGIRQVDSRVTSLGKEFLDTAILLFKNNWDNMSGNLKIRKIHGRMLNPVKRLKCIYKFTFDKTDIPRMSLVLN